MSASSGWKPAAFHKEEGEGSQFRCAPDASRYSARKALVATEPEARLVETLNDRCADRALIEDDPTVVASIQHLAQTAYEPQRIAGCAFLG